MKRIYFLLLILLLALGIGGYAAYNELFPMAKPIVVAQQEQIQSVSVSLQDVAETTITDATALLAMIADAEPTRIMSVNDDPTAKVYYTVTAAVPEREYRYFVYEDNGEVLIEIPYEGVYRADRELLVQIKKMIEP